MALAAKELRYYHRRNQLQKFRLWVVRAMSSILSPSPEKTVPLMTESYEHLEEMARSRVLTKTKIQKSAFAIIAIGQEAERRYLLQWNANWHMFNLIGGKIDNSKGDNENLRQTMKRELEEELGVVCPQECRIGRELGRINLQQYSHREHIVKNYHFALYDVSVLPNLPIDWDSPHYFARWLSTGRENIYVTAEEIQNLSTVNGRPISATTRQILQALGEIPDPFTN
jgi:8-oxo-dGTP pyrophosphatase MutT (NUDIX family)